MWYLGERVYYWHLGPSWRRVLMQCTYAYLFRSILVVYCLFFIIILCFYNLSMCCFCSQCILGLFICFDVFLGLMIIEKGLELVRTSWKAKRLNFGRMVTVTSRATWDESLQRASVMSRHPGTTRHRV